MPTRPLCPGTFFSSQSIVSEVSEASSTAFGSDLSRGGLCITKPPSDL
jgi:hypothetical protein